MNHMKLTDLNPGDKFKLTGRNVDEKFKNVIYTVFKIEELPNQGVNIYIGEGICLTFWEEYNNSIEIIEFSNET